MITRFPWMLSSVSVPQSSKIVFAGTSHRLLQQREDQVLFGYEQPQVQRQTRKATDVIEQLQKEDSGVIGAFMQDKDDFIAFFLLNKIHDKEKHAYLLALYDKDKTIQEFTIIEPDGYCLNIEDYPFTFIPHDNQKLTLHEQCLQEAQRLVNQGWQITTKGWPEIERVLSRDFCKSSSKHPLKKIMLSTTPLLFVDTALLKKLVGKIENSYCGVVFKINNDQMKGKLGFLRPYDPMYPESPYDSDNYKDKDKYTLVFQQNVFLSSPLQRAVYVFSPDDGEILMAYTVDQNRNKKSLMTEEGVWDIRQLLRMLIDKDPDHQLYSRERQYRPHS